MLQYTFVRYLSSETCFGLSAGRSYATYYSIRLLNSRRSFLLEITGYKVATEKLRLIASRIKYIYMLVYMVCFSMFNNAYLHAYYYNETQLMYQGLIFFGLALLVFDFFTFSVMLKTKYSVMLVLFYVACMASVIFNLKYDPVSNVKVIAWMLIQTFVFAAVDRTLPREHHKKYFKLVSEAVAIVWVSLSAWSISMFFSGYYAYLVNAEVFAGYARVGFVDGRLFGAFTDPNFASVCILFSMAMILSDMFMTKQSLPEKIYHIVILVIDYTYILLSRSRTAELALIVVMAVIGFFASKHLLEKRGLSVLCKIAVMIVSAAVCAYGTSVISTTLNSAADTVYIALHEEDDMTDEEKKQLEEETKRSDVEETDDVTNNRSTIWTDYLKVFLENPFIGTGPRNGLAYANEHMPDSYIVEMQYQYHNGYLAVLVGTGVIGFLLVMLYIVLVAKKVIVYLWTKSGEYGKDYISVLMLCTVLVVGAISALPLHILFFNNSASDAMFWFVLGYVLYMVCDGEQRKSSRLVRLTDVFRAKIFKETNTEQ